MTQSSHHSLLSRLSLFVLSGCIALQGQAWAMGRIDIASQKNLGLIGTNPGGGIEVVVPPNGVTMKYFGTQ